MPEEECDIFGMVASFLCERMKKKLNQSHAIWVGFLLDRYTESVIVDQSERNSYPT